jgi:hypothetical protein
MRLFHDNSEGLIAIPIWRAERLGQWQLRATTCSACKRGCRHDHILGQVSPGNRRALKYGEVISSDADDESVFYLTDPEEVPLGAIRPWPSAPASATAREDDDRTADLTNEENTFAAQTIMVESSHGFFLGTQGSQSTLGP